MYRATYVYVDPNKQTHPQHRSRQTNMPYKLIPSQTNTTDDHDLVLSQYPFIPTWKPNFYQAVTDPGAPPTRPDAVMQSADKGRGYSGHGHLWITRPAPAPPHHVSGRRLKAFPRR